MSGRVIKLTESQYKYINEAKTYYPNMDIDIIKNGRKAPKMNVEKFKEKLEKVFTEYFPEDKFNPSSFIFKLCRYASPEYPKLHQMHMDLNKVKVDGENCDIIDDVKTTKSGIPYILAYKGGDWEYPVLFCIYHDGSKIRGYIPTYGNCFDRFNNEAFGNNDTDDEKTIHKLFKDAQHDISYIRNHMKYNKDACIKDIEAHITTKSNIKENISIDNFNKEKIKKLITEELGIADEVTKEAKKLCDYTIAELSKTKYEKVRPFINSEEFNEIGMKTFSFSYMLFDNKVSVSINHYYIPTWEMYEKWKNSKFAVALNGGSVRRDCKTKTITMLFLNTLSINNKLDREFFYDEIWHEVQHFYEQKMMNKSFGSNKYYRTAATNIASSNDVQKKIAIVMYMRDPHELSSFENGIYSQFTGDNIDMPTFDKMRKTNLYNILLKVQEIKQYAKENKDNTDFIALLQEYDMNITPDKFIKYAEFVEKNIYRVFSRVIIKIKQDLLKINEHIKYMLPIDQKNKMIFEHI